MWQWLFGKKQTVAPPSPEEVEEARYAIKVRLKGMVSAGGVDKLLKAEGYQGGFANVCEGKMAIVYLEPGVLLDPEWVEPASNLFQMRILDCEAFCEGGVFFIVGNGDQASRSRMGQASHDPRQMASTANDDRELISCLLSYPCSSERIPDGCQFQSSDMEDLWNVFLFNEQFYFTRSWTGELRYRADITFRRGAMFITAIQAFAKQSQSVVNVPCDDDFAVAQVDFLIKTLLHQVKAPAPLPKSLRRDGGYIAWYSLMEYGRRGAFPTFEETTEYRICLNGVKGRFPPRPENELLPLIRAVEQSDNPATRGELIDSLRGRQLYLGCVISDQDVLNSVDEETPLSFVMQQWDGKPAIFAYTDPAFRCVPAMGSIGIEVVGLSGFVGQQDRQAGVVINPAGPATCVLSCGDLAALAE